MYIYKYYRYVYIYIYIFIHYIYTSTALAGFRCGLCLGLQAQAPGLQVARPQPAFRFRYYRCLNTYLYYFRNVPQALKKYTILGVPYYNYSIMGLKNLFSLSRPLCYVLGLQALWRLAAVPMEEEYCMPRLLAECRQKDASGIVGRSPISLLIQQKHEIPKEYVN